MEARTNGAADAWNRLTNAAAALTAVGGVLAASLFGVGGLVEAIRLATYKYNWLPLLSGLPRTTLITTGVVEVLAPVTPVAALLGWWLSEYNATNTHWLLKLRRRFGNCCANVWFCVFVVSIAGLLTAAAALGLTAIGKSYIHQPWPVRGALTAAVTAGWLGCWISPVKSVRKLAAQPAMPNRWAYRVALTAMMAAVLALPAAAIAGASHLQTVVLCRGQTVYSGDLLADHDGNISLGVYVESVGGNTHIGRQVLILKTDSVTVIRTVLPFPHDRPPPIYCPPK